MKTLLTALLVLQNTLAITAYADIQSTWRSVGPARPRSRCPSRPTHRRTIYLEASVVC
jgi:hypothetical protein